MRAPPSLLNHLLKAPPPNTNTVRGYEFWRATDIHSITATVINGKLMNVILRIEACIRLSDELLGL